MLLKSKRFLLCTSAVNTYSFVMRKKSIELILSKLSHSNKIFLIADLKRIKPDSHFVLLPLEKAFKICLLYP